MYIERDDNCECGCECCKENTPTPEPDISCEDAENLARWKWLIDGWDEMNFIESFSLFTPYLHYINLRDHFKPAFDDQLNAEVLDLSFKLCRTIQQIKFDPDGQGIPNILVVLNPINPEMIPNARIKAEVINWKIKYFG